jgi:amidohydrolase
MPVMPLSLSQLIALRQELHRFPELSGEESATAQRISAFFAQMSYTKLIQNLGGTGLAFLWEGEKEGPTTLFRCELDGLPILEKGAVPYRSEMVGKSHVCGHDGHMAILSGLGLYLDESPPMRGKVVLLFQPAEETGDGARAVLADPRFAEIRPDYAFALHNLPGFPLHQIVAKPGSFAASSVGMSIFLHGRNAHSAHPEAGNSPAQAMAEVIQMLEKLPKDFEDFTLVTVIHAELGQIAFGTTPGEAVVRATMRAFDNAVKARLVAVAEMKSSEIAGKFGLGIELRYQEDFAASHNDPEGFEILRQVAEDLNLDLKEVAVPFRWSEDFGLFSDYAKSMLFGLGSGLEQPQLHEPNFDFPDQLIPTGISIFSRIIQKLNH